MHSVLVFLVFLVIWALASAMLLGPLGVEKLRRQRRRKALWAAFRRGNELRKQAKADAILQARVSEQQRQAAIAAEVERVRYEQGLVERLIHERNVRLGRKEEAVCV